MRKHPLGIKHDVHFWRMVGAYWTILIVGVLIAGVVALFGFELWSITPEWLKGRRSPVFVLLCVAGGALLSAFFVYGVHAIHKTWRVRPGDHLDFAQDEDVSSVRDYPKNLRSKIGDDGPRP